MNALNLTMKRRGRVADFESESFHASTWNDISTEKRRLAVPVLKQEQR
jgi:hypothetical protein